VSKRRPVRQSGGLTGEVVVELDQHLQFRQGLLAGVDPAQYVRQGPGGVGGHLRVTGVGLRGARVEVNDPAHRQSWPDSRDESPTGLSDLHRSSLGLWQSGMMRRASPW